MVDLSIGVGLPILQMALQYTVQGHRFNIYEDVGCYFFTYNVWPAYLIQFGWPLVVGLISAVYCVLSIRAFYRRQSQFKELLSLNKNLNAGRYLRLMCLASVDLVCTVPFAVYFIYSDLHLQPGLSPYKGWADTHAHFSRVNQIPAIIWRYDARNATSLELSRWLIIVCAFVFFMFFGFADEARKHYRSGYQTVAKTIGLSTRSTTSGMATSDGAKSNMRSFGKTSLPVFVRRQATTKRDSIGSYNEKLSIADAGGALAYKPDPYTLTEFSGTSSSAGSTLLPSLPDDDCSISIPEPPAVARPEPALDLSTITQQLGDPPSSAHSSRHNSVDMV
jgi:pheromone a factor receptor